MTDLLDAVLRRVTPERLRAAAVRVTSIPSPTGREGPLAAWLAEELRASGIDGRVQSIDAEQANAVGRVRGARTGPDLMLYAPIDTLTTGDPAEDVPWIGPRLRPDMLPDGQADGDLVRGLGAGNPKGHAACVLVTGQAYAEAVAELGIAPAGDLVLAFGAGGMPTNAIGAGRANTGHGVGASFLLERGWYTDHAIIAKPGDFVAHDEVGLCWFEIVVHGVHTYAGSRHRLPYSNPIVSAAEVAVRLERWLAGFPARHRTATAAPQGVIGAVAGGWERMPAVTPAACRLRLDVRLAPGQRPLDVRRELSAFLDDVAAATGADLDCELVAHIPGSTTDPGSWVIRETVRAWEAASGRPHRPIPDNSGATDANILRGRGVPTARVGMPKVVPADGTADFAQGMNTVSVTAMRRLCEVLARVAVANALGARRTHGPGPEEGEER
ncbi:acetylornithine deacetylase/succinyl-diaminopimelate desuccinylase-like protein [Actinomadura pelletieri DSM 43383]|uniref:Acetylornithine deacetylase/succinyl-diaminopimelate desuccinylase-like protein n=1 Tax=Actinomadura pelletieri DSM 43383 TaxID=1120940 RepID=A0A495QL37_9ACTN|nr:peptidase dimerization domain-containing protein [Actinomadura pelletieri]RKS73141.1 acetylornithine deacetylase/succinyl-diaminopimelate desuccinylase-like protein [Actinomadura pelletieri DSM 43383]